MATRQNPIFKGAVGEYDQVKWVKAPFRILFMCFLKNLFSPRNVRYFPMGKVTDMRGTSFKKFAEDCKKELNKEAK